MPSDPKIAFAMKSVEVIKETKSNAGETAGLDVGEKVARTAGAFSQAATEVVVTEGLAAGAAIVGGAAGATATRAVLSTKPGKAVVGGVGKAVGKTVEVQTRTTTKTIKVVLALMLLAAMAYLALIVFFFLWIAQVFQDGNQTTETLDARTSEQVSVVTPDQFLSPSSPHPALGKVADAAHDILIELWVEELESERSGYVLVEVTDPEWEIIWSSGGGIRLTATVTTEDDEGNRETSDVVSEYWYYQMQESGCHPALIMSSLYSDINRQVVVGKECWKLNDGGLVPTGPQVRGMLVGALAGQGAAWEPPLYDYVHCVEVTGEKDACEHWFDNLNPEGAATDPPTATWGVFPTAKQIQDLAATLPPDPDADPDADGEIDVEKLELHSVVGRYGQAPILDTGLHYQYEQLTSEGSQQLAWDTYTAWIVWHNPLEHVPHHYPAIDDLDLGCSKTYSDADPLSGDWDSVESPMWRDYASKQGKAVESTSRGAAWVEHYLAMGSGLSAWAQGDVLGGCVARPMLALLGHLAARKAIYVSPLRSGHAPNVAGGDRESMHHRGRGADIFTVGGEIMVYDSPEGYWLWRLLVEFKERGRMSIMEIGSPWELVEWVDGDGIFTDDDHEDHIHVGVCGVRYESIANQVESDSC